MSLMPAFELGLWNAWILMAIFIVFHLATYLLLKQIDKGYLEERVGETPGNVPFTQREKIIDRFSSVILVFLFAYSIFLPLQLGTPWLYVGLAIFVLGQIFGTLYQIPWATTPTDEPFTEGIYRYSRHPLFLSVFLRFAGVGIASVSWVVVLLSIVLLSLTRSVAIAEERWCLEKYGDAYREYIDRTPRWIGIPKSKKKSV